MIAKAIIITTILEHLRTYIQEIPEITIIATQAVKSTTTRISRNKIIQNIKKSYKTAVLAITIATNMMDCTSHRNWHQSANRSKHSIPGM